MPLYRFRNTETDEVFEEMMSYDDSKTFLEENPQYTRIIGAPMIVSGVGSGPRVDNGFKEVMNKIKDGHSVRGPQIDKWTK